MAALGLAAATVLSLTAPAFAKGAKPAKTPAQNAGSSLIDPATGKLRQPTPAEKRALAAGVRAMFQNSPSPLLSTKQFGDGTASFNIGSSFLNVSIAQVGADGAIHQICLDNPADADALASSTSTPAYEDK